MRFKELFSRKTRPKNRGPPADPEVTEKAKTAVNDLLVRRQSERDNDETNATTTSGKKSTQTDRKCSIGDPKPVTKKAVESAKPAESKPSVPDKDKEPPKPLKTETKKDADLPQPSTPGTKSGDEDRVSPVPPAKVTPAKVTKDASENILEDAPQLISAYDQIPVLDQVKLPRGGLSIETKAVGRVQFGIPPETIKDSMILGLPVPEVYIVPVERFCREMGPALGVNLAEFEFPAYFNFFIYKKRCTLVVDSTDAEDNIRRVFSETLLGPAQFRRDIDPIPYEEEDFAPEFPRSAIPNFTKELRHFRIMPDGSELVIETLLNFCHFEMSGDGHENLGIPPNVDEESLASSHASALAAHNSEEEAAEAQAEEVPKDEKEIEKREQKSPWTYSHARFSGDVATVWPVKATPEQIKNRSVPRVEVFKMPGGTEYIIHDIDEHNHIVGKARFSGHVKVSELISVNGFGGHSIMDDVDPNALDKKTNDMLDESEGSFSILKGDPVEPGEAPPTFHPPSFGVTILGNSHGFDKNGSVSGYVLWINGRGVMIDPPPYSSATLEREGIRPRTIVGIIVTHCHADHDAGTFQKCLTGSPVVVITTPTIYKSFIRKYAALSALSPALLRHSHRYKPAIIGQPLRFQGATFHFTYTLHSIPTVGFRVEWRGRSMVFTADHMNIPSAINKLQQTAVLSGARADDLRNLPLQDTDALLHESGAPPIHTPLDVLLDLPVKVKKRLYVVHTSALPEGCELRVAPTGTAGTLRLDQPEKSCGTSQNHASSATLTEDVWNAQNEYETISEGAAADGRLMASSFAHLQVLNQPKNKARANSVFAGDLKAPPLVSMRAASSTDAWFILNLLSAVPFLSSLSYASTMEVLETARVDAYSMDDVIVPAARRSQLLCVVWEGTCSERRTGTAPGASKTTNMLNSIEEDSERFAVWHAGDWTGPIALQPKRRLSGESERSKTFDITAVSSEGVKVITIEFSSLHTILKNGSTLYRKYLERKRQQEKKKKQMDTVPENEANTTEQLIDDAVRDLNILELLNCNSALRKLNAVQKRHLESLAEGPERFKPGERMWSAGTPVDKAFIVVHGTASFVPKRRNAGEKHDTGAGDSIRVDAGTAIKELRNRPAGESPSEDSSLASGELEDSNKRSIQFDAIFTRAADNSSLADVNDYDKLSRGLQKRADYLHSQELEPSEGSQDDEHSLETENESQLDYTFTDEADAGQRSRRSSVNRRRASRARYANKVFGRLYNRRAFTGGLVFSRGHFLGDVSKMVAGLLSSDLFEMGDDSGPSYGFGDKSEGKGGNNLLENISETVIHEQEGDHTVMHSSTLTAGNDGCVVLVFPKSSLIPFLDEYPGFLLSLLGTQVVV